MSRVAALQARVDALEGQVEKYLAYAKACRTAADKVSGSGDAIAADPVELSTMQSRAPRIDRAQRKVASAQTTVVRVRGRLSVAASDLGAITDKWQRKAETATTQLAAARVELAAAVIEEALS